MTAEPATQPRTPKEILRFFDEEFRQRVVRRALEHRSESKVLRDALRGLTVKGYRDAGRAVPPAILLPAVSEAIIGPDQDDLGRAVLTAWVDSHGGLRDRVAEYLEGRGMLVREPPDASFDSFWTVEEWRDERKALVAGNGILDDDSVGLMLSLLARRFPAPPPLASTLFKGWLDSLRDLPPNAPEWREADAFIKWMMDFRCEKTRERLRFDMEQITDRSSSLRQRFDEELRYLGIDPDPWPELVENRPPLTEAALELLDSLTACMETYRPIRPQASSRAKELKRSVKRGECEESILATVDAWQGRVDQPDPSDEDPSGVEADAVATPRPANGADAGTEPASGMPKDEDGSIRRELEALRRDRSRLEEDNQALRAEKAHRDEEAGRLREEASRSGRMEKHWRLAFIEERRQASVLDGKSAAVAPVGSVREAIAQARKMFPDRLLIQLNSRSKEDTPFENPQEVLDALAWLATAYRKGPAESIADTCPGWQCKEHQSATTMGQYPDWYRTHVNGTAWELKPRLAKGKNHDPRHTIRIAFAWDEANDRVIVGFIGLHQRNRSS